MLLVRGRLGVQVLLASLASIGCNSSMEPIPTVQEPPELGRDSLVVGAIAFSCGRWTTEVEWVDDWSFLDLYFRRSPGEPDDGPTAEQRAAVDRTRAVVRDVFNFPAMRALVSRNDVEHLYTQQVLLYARTVPYSDRADVRVLVGFVSGDSLSWSEAIEGRGGETERFFRDLQIVSGAIPNDSAPILRTWSGVGYVEVNSPVCPL